MSVDILGEHHGVYRCNRLNTQIFAEPSHSEACHVSGPHKLSLLGLGHRSSGSGTTNSSCRGLGGLKETWAKNHLSAEASLDS